MSKKIKIKFNHDSNQPEVFIDDKKVKDDKNVKVKDNGDIELISNDETIEVPVTTWNHGAGWNSITIEF